MNLKWHFLVNTDKYCVFPLLSQCIRHSILLRTATENLVCLPFKSSVYSYGKEIQMGKLVFGILSNVAEHGAGN